MGGIKRYPFSITISDKIADRIRRESVETGKKINYIVEKVFAERYDMVEWHDAAMLASCEPSSKPGTA